MGLRSAIAAGVSFALKPLGLQAAPAGASIEDNAWSDQKRLVPDARVILDAGANVGQSVRAYRRLYRGATIHSFEPFPESFSKLSEVCEAEGNARPYQIALAEAPGKLDLFVNNQSSQNSLYAFVDDAAQVSPLEKLTTLGKVEVEVSTLDAWAAANGVEKVDILKVDVQGAELRLLQGGAGLLGRGAIDLIFAETAFDDTYKGGADFADVRAFLAEKGYSLYGLYYLRQNRGSMLQFCDAIYVSPALKSRVQSDPKRYFVHS